MANFMHAHNEWRLIVLLFSYRSESPELQPTINQQIGTELALMSTVETAVAPL
jgi:hypothetical protein